MIKILYIPSGECILFATSEKYFKDTGHEYSPDYEVSHWKLAWNDPPEALIEHFCSPSTESETKETHKIPVGIKLDPKEFELIRE